MFLSVAVALGEASWTLGYTCSEKNAQVHLFFCRLSGFVHDTQNHVYKRRRWKISGQQQSELSTLGFALPFRFLGGERMPTLPMDALPTIPALLPSQEKSIFSSSIRAVRTS